MTEPKWITDIAEWATQLEHARVAHHSQSHNAIVDLRCVQQLVAHLREVRAALIYELSDNCWCEGDDKCPHCKNRAVLSRTEPPKIGD